jgi:hypothetical protein
MAPSPRERNQVNRFQHSHYTSALHHLSAGISNGSALPLYLSPPEPFPLARKLRKFSHAGDGLLDMKNAEDSTYSAFTAPEEPNSTMNSSLTRLIRYVLGGKEVFAAL